MDIDPPRLQIVENFFFFKNIQPDHLYIWSD